MSRSCRLFTSMDQSEIRSFLNSFDTIVTDCDGVLWRGNSPIGEAAKVVNAFRDLGKNVIYVTNNSTKSRKELHKKFIDLGFGGDYQDIFNPSYLAALNLKTRNFDKKVYVLGSKGITQELEEAGLQHIGLGPDPVPSDWSLDVAQSVANNLDPDVGCVIVGFDLELSYLKLVKVASYLARPEMIFLGTNTDERFPVSENCTIPGTATFIAAVTVATGRFPLILGKPFNYMFEAVRQVHPQIVPDRTLMIGDKCDTDILFGQRCGLKTLHVGSGVDSLDSIRELEASNNEDDIDCVPDFHLDELGSLLPHLMDLTKD